MSKVNESFFSLPDEKRNAILNAGFRVFSRHEYKKSPMNEIERDFMKMAEFWKKLVLRKKGE